MTNLQACRVAGPLAPRPVVFDDWLERECARRATAPRVVRRFRFPRVRTQHVEKRAIWIIDAMDVATCRVTDDPRDERGCLRRLALLLDLYARTHGDRVTAVFEGEPFELSPTDRLCIQVRFTEGSTRFEVLSRILTSCRRPHEAYVATSNEAFALSVRHHGAQVIPSRVFRGWLESLQW